MDETLLDLVLKRLDEMPIEKKAESLLLAACDDDAALAAELSGESRGRREREAAGAVSGPAGAYLRSITVSGFRGVGPAATLELEPGPGLTLIVGRNGSGKSSFAEGLEVLLTGELRRWQELTAAWREGWRNLHAPGQVRLSVDLLLEGAGPATAERSWDGDAGFGDSRARVQVSGEKRADLGRLGWKEPLITYRPFLSHSELEAFLHGPSHLYDLLSSVLGLDDLDAAAKRLAAARKEREDGLKAVSAGLPALLVRLGTLDDERARSCRDALGGRRRDLPRALSIATGSPTARPDSEIGRLRLLSQVTAPARERAEDAVTALRTAAGEMARAVGSEAGQALALADLLSSALDHYHAHGAGPCPVCGRARALDEQWQERTGQQITRLKTAASQAQQAHTLAAEARGKARELFPPVPAGLAGLPVGTADPGPGPGLSEAASVVASSAEGELRAREDLWTPVARDVAAWCKRAQDAEAAAEDVPALKAAIRWLKDATDGIRNDRLVPLGDQARGVWSRLRQESNVNLGTIRLSGSATRRQVDVNVTVDGSPGAALGVMSQGEINALSASALPRGAGRRVIAQTSPVARGADSTTGKSLFLLFPQVREAGLAS